MLKDKSRCRYTCRYQIGLSSVVCSTQKLPVLDVEEADENELVSILFELAGLALLSHVE